ELAQPLQLVPELLGGPLAQVDVEVAHDLRDDPAPPDVIGRAGEAALGREFAFRHRVAIARDRVHVLGIEPTHVADPGDAERHHVVGRLYRVTLEVAREAAPRLRLCQLVVGAAGVIPADRALAPGRARL